MPEPTTAIPTGGEDKEHLADVGGGVPTTDPEASTALDKLFADATGEPVTPPEKKADEPPVTPPETPAAKPPAKPDETPATPPVKPDEPPAVPPAKPPVKPDETPAPKSVTDFEKIELPPYAKPATTEAFATVKQIARTQISTLASELEATKAKLTEAEKKAGAPGLTPEIEAELKELRGFRQKMDVEADPSFKEWDTKIKANEEAIYAKLKASGAVDDAGIKKIQELGGPAAVDWDAVGEKLTPTVRRYIEGKIFESEDLGEKKRVAVESAKANASEFLGGVASSRQKTVQSVVDQNLPKLEWLKDAEPPKDATPEQIAAVKKQNEFLGGVRSSMKEVIDDDSPTTKALLVLGYAQLQRVRADYEALKATNTAEIEKIKAESAAKITKLETDLAASNKLVEGIKKSSTARLRESSAPAHGEKPVSKPTDITTHPGDALDTLLAESLAAKA